MKLMVDIINLIKKMLTHGLSGQEKIELSEQQQMQRLLSAQWEESSESHIQDKVKATEMWGHIEASCWGGTAKKRVRPIVYMYSVAAAIAILVVGVWMVNLLTESYITVSAPSDSNLVYTLPDNSKVWLNVGSTIRYSQKFSSDRKVELTGEAFFNVTKNAEYPFRVLFNEACVEVKGTEFNVKSGTDFDEITLFSGAIVFSTPEIEPLEMKPFEQIVCDVTGKYLKLSRVDTVEYDWRSTEFKFVDKPLKELVEFLNRIYKVEISVKDKSYEEMLFTATIRKDEPLSDVLDKICISFDLEKQVSGNSIILH